MRIITEIMSRREAAATRRPELREMPCVIIDDEKDGGGNVRYWRSSMTGYTPNLEDAGLYNLGSFLDASSRHNIGFIKEGEPVPGPDGKSRLRMAKMVLGSSVYEMVLVSPNNPVVRAHIMAKCGEMPKDELDTTQKLIDWIECDLTMATAAASLLKPAATPVPATTARTARPAPAFTVETENTETENGTCSYSRTEHTTSRVLITAARIEELLDPDENFDLEEIIDRLSDDVDAKAIDSADHSEYTDEETNDYNPNSGEGLNVGFRSETLKQQLIEYLRRTQTRELLSSLGIIE